MSDSIDQPWLQGFPWPKGGAGSVDPAALKTNTSREPKRGADIYPSLLVIYCTLTLVAGVLNSIASLLHVYNRVVCISHVGQTIEKTLHPCLHSI